MKSVAAILTLYASTVWGANHMVTVGAGGFVFNPTSITAAVGDTVEFVFTGVSRTALLNFLMQTVLESFSRFSCLRFTLQTKWR